MGSDSASAGHAHPATRCSRVSWGHRVHQDDARSYLPRFQSSLPRPTFGLQHACVAPAQQSDLVLLWLCCVILHQPPCFTRIFKASRALLPYEPGSNCCLRLCNAARMVSVCRTTQFMPAAHRVHLCSPLCTTCLPAALPAGPGAGDRIRVACAEPRLAAASWTLYARESPADAAPATGPKAAS